MEAVLCMSLFVYLFSLVALAQTQCLCSLVPQHSNHLTQWHNAFDKYK